MECLLQLCNNCSYIFITLAVSVAGVLVLKRWVKGGVCRSKTRIEGKTVIITGGNTGIGYETAKELALRGAKIIIGSRDKAKTEKAVAELKEKTGCKDISYELLDLASLASVRKFADTILKKEDKIDILINNAGVMMCPYMKSEDGYEMQFAVNHLGHFLLTNLLLDRIKASAPSRIINLSSLMHITGQINFEDINSEKKYNSVAAYGQSKLANVLFTIELSDRLKGCDVTANSLHPGSVNTELQRYAMEWWILSVFPCNVFVKIMRWFFKTPNDGAQTSIYCAVDETLNDMTGKYFSDCALHDTSKAAKDKDVAKRLWKLSEEMVGLTS